MRPLEGLEVVAIEQAVAGPIASCRLADAGAHVTKVERPEGDFARGYDDVAKGQASYFVWLNRGKETVTLDLTSDAGKAALADLIAKADVLIQNLKPGSLARLGFDLDRLHAENPRLISCSISGYGEGGPLANRKAYDLLIQAESGLCSVTGGPTEPARVGTSVVDIATGSTAYEAILEAIIGRGVSGKGARISVSMFDVMAEWLTVPLLNHEGGKSPKRVGLAHPSIAPYGVFQPKSGAPILISIQSDREWRMLAKHFLEDESLATEPRFATNVARVQNRAETDALVGAAFAKHASEEAVARLDAANIALAQVNDMAGLSAHPHLRRITVDSPNGSVSFPAPGAQFEGQPRSYGPVPALKPLEP
ncbi:CaiB/BaiF CoA transferase family protein [Actibacterium pelagium]|uniref:CoA transferase n=1 Tax=Actibacterium pelagium TaxID=2029103 RepID=A0A917AAW8_9RHOB|nr:CaiB/BaiF CoA-transferase family protein [Actibacterium pelagium]GGE38421.1 CoA transferase [Actibacterium pelagium]